MASEAEALVAFAESVGAFSEAVNSLTNQLAADIARLDNELAEVRDGLVRLESHISATARLLHARTDGMG